MLGLTVLGALHTLISLVAVGAGFAAIFQGDHRIDWTTPPGRVFIVATLLTCVTGFGIFQHGGFGKPHALGIVTLLALGIALGAELKGWFGKKARHIAVAAYSFTFMLHFIPGVTETLTRLPVGDPIFESPDAPELQIIAASFFMVYLICVTVQLLQLSPRPAEDEDDETPLPR